MDTTQYLKQWRESAEDAVKAMQFLANTLRNWERWKRGLTDEEFQETMRFLRDQGLDGWADSHPLSIDVLYGVMVDGMSHEEAVHEYGHDLTEEIREAFDNFEF